VGKVAGALFPLNQFQNGLPGFEIKKFLLLCQMAYPGVPGPGDGPQHQQLSNRVSGQSLSPWPCSLPAEEMDLRHLFLWHKARQGSASTSDGQEAYKHTESTQILAGETQVWKCHVRDREN